MSAKDDRSLRHSGLRCGHRLRVVFMGTPEFAVPTLAALHAQTDLCQIAAIYTQPDRPSGRGLALTPPSVKSKAIELHLPVFQPEKLSTDTEFAKLKALAPDVIVVVAFGVLLKNEVLQLPRLGCVNIHSSLLPRWRGAAPIQWAILSGDAETGVTTMRITQKLDSGNILLQAKMAIRPDDTGGTLHDRLARMAAELIVPTLIGLESGNLQERGQNEAETTYASKLTKEMEWLLPTEAAEKLDRRIRAFHPWPGTSVAVELPSSTGAAHWERLKIKGAVLRMEIAPQTGHVFEKAGMLFLGAVDGSLELKKLQWEGKKEVDAAHFVNGLRGRGLSLPLRYRGSA